MDCILQLAEDGEGLPRFASAEQLARAALRVTENRQMRHGELTVEWRPDPAE